MSNENKIIRVGGAVGMHDYSVSFNAYHDTEINEWVGEIITYSEGVEFTQRELREVPAEPCEYCQSEPNEYITLVTPGATRVGRVETKSMPANFCGNCGRRLGDE